MSSNHQSVEKLIKSDYKYGFVTDIDSDTFPLGLNESIIRQISAKKNEPDWMQQWRLKAYQRWLSMEDPEWAHIQHPEIDFQAISYYSAPKQKGDATNY